MSPKYFTKTSLNCGRKSGYQERTHGHEKNMYTPQLLFLSDFGVLKVFWLRLASWIPNCDFVGCSKTHQTGITVLDMYATSHFGTLKSALCQLW